ncbi:DUF697 domain-containing protein [Geminocystis herdmanii]|uniref:DUF697 domain-containing protein n=1 Tax=Geminocystis herdmanii TaxID=669359 RepID=UPI000348AD05|nr:DUF697 domain-containing protein [Geminocystis herdmanii]
MTISIKKPILVVGVSLSFLLWIGENLKNTFDEVGNVTLFALILMGSIWLFWQRKKTPLIIPNFSLSSVSRIDFDKKNQQIKNLLDTLVKESSEDLGNIFQDKFNSSLSSIEQSITKKYLDLTIINHNKIISSSIVNNLQQKFVDDIKWFSETNFLNYDQNIAINQNNNNQKSNSLTLNNLKNLSLKSDLVLFVIQGDITESEKQIITQINKNQRILVLFNDIDYPLAEEKTLIFTNIKNKLKEIINSEFIIAISTQSKKVKVKKYLDEVNYQEWEEVTQGEYNNLLNTLKITVEKEKDNLILATAYRNSIELEKAIKKELNLIRKEKALPLLEKYQIVAATATFANPVSSLDLLATAAINTQMIVDLSSIYQQSLSLNQAKEISIELAKLMVKLGMVEISSQAITAILKTNAITYVAGGIIQGISAAYLTRLCGLSLIEYYEIAELNNNQSINLKIIKEKLQLIFQQTKDNNFLTKFVTKITKNEQLSFN